MVKEMRTHPKWLLILLSLHLLPLSSPPPQISLLSTIHLLSLPISSLSKRNHSSSFPLSLFTQLRYKASPLKFQGPGIRFRHGTITFPASSSYVTHPHLCWRHSETMDKEVSNQSKKTMIDIEIQISISETSSGWATN